MRISLVSAFLPEVTQQIHSLRASGVMSFHSASTFGTEEIAFRKSAGRACTVPQMRKLGFDFKAVSNTVRITDVQTALLPPGNALSALPPGALACYEHSLECTGEYYYVKVEAGRGVGNMAYRFVGVILDHVTKGWWFEAKIYTLPRKYLEPDLQGTRAGEEIVVAHYKYGGKRDIDERSLDVNPLGWLGRLAGGLREIVPGIPNPNTN